MTGRALIDYGRLLHVLGIEAELLASSVDESRLDELVPGCPGLTAGETARHVGSLYRMVLGWLRDGAKPTEWQREPESGQSLPDFVRSGIVPLLTELSAHSSDEDCPTWWTTDSNYGFWRRRMAHETTVHRTDVQGALGLPISEIAEDIAIDGIDEVLSLWLEHRMSVLGVYGTREYSVAIRSGSREWLVKANPVGTSVLRLWSADEATWQPGTEDAAISGPPALVYRWLWGRMATHDVRREGNLDAIGQLWALLRLATR